MTPRRDALRAGSHWHVDCRLEGELPKDDVVSGRFLATVFFSSVTLGLLLLCTWLGYQTWNLTRQVNETNARVAASMPEVRIIQRLQKEYVAEASKIDQAYGTIRPAIVVSEFVAILSRSLPREINVETLEWRDTEVIMQGFLRESRKDSARIIEQYVAVLKSHPQLATQFDLIRQAGYDASKGSFAISFRLVPLPPL